MRSEGDARGAMAHETARRIVVVDCEASNDIRRARVDPVNWPHRAAVLLGQRERAVEPEFVFRCQGQVEPPSGRAVRQGILLVRIVSRRRDDFPHVGGNVFRHVQRGLQNANARGVSRFWRRCLAL